MDMILTLLAVVGLSTAVSHIEGPFGVFSKLRTLLGHIPVLGPMLLALLTCNFCLGFWSGVAVYVATGGSLLNWSDMLVFALAGATTNSLVAKVLESNNTTTVETVSSKE